MNGERSRWIAAGFLLLATAVAGALARVHAPLGGAALSAPFTAAADGISLHGTLDRTAVLRGGDGTARMELVIAAAAAAAENADRRPTDLVVILDRSGSMEGDKIVHARAAVVELLQHLQPHDRFALVSYASDVRVDVALAEADAANRAAALRAVARIGTGGGTNISGGLDAALAMVDGRRSPLRVPRLILISDGLANEGDASPQGLIARARRAAAGEFALSAIGVGEDFNEYLMSALADAGTGNYYYVRHSEDLGAVFAREFDAARATVATGLALHVRPAAGVRVVDAAGYPVERAGDEYVVRPGDLFAGQERRLWLTLAIPNDAVGEFEVGSVALRYTVADARHGLQLDALPKIACVAAASDYYANVDADAWGRSVAVEEYNAMQDDVAREVKAGNRDGALAIIGAFRGRLGAENRHVAAPAVADKLDEAERLEGEIRDAFSGDAATQAKRQNLLSKSKSAEALDARRAGAKKEAGR